MYRSKIIFFLLASFSSFIPSAIVTASESQDYYIGLGLGFSNVGLPEGQRSTGLENHQFVVDDNSDTGNRITFGLAYNDFLDVDLSYISVGTFSASQISNYSQLATLVRTVYDFDYSGFAFGVRPYYQLRNRVRLKANLALFHLTRDTSISLSSSNNLVSLAGIAPEDVYPEDDESSVEILYGAGISYRVFENWRLAYDLNYVDHADESIGTSEISLSKEFAAKSYF